MVNNFFFFFLLEIRSLFLVQPFRRLILYLERVTDENKIVLENVLGQLLTVIDDSDKQSLMACVHENIQKVCFFFFFHGNYDCYYLHILL